MHPSQHPVILSEVKDPQLLPGVPPNRPEQIRSQSSLILGYTDGYRYHLHSERVVTGAPMDALIDFAVKHLAALFYLILGIGVVFYSCFAKRMSFEGDVAVRPEERKTYRATPAMRRYGLALGMFPLLYGLYLLIFR